MKRTQEPHKYNTINKAVMTTFMGHREVMKSAMEGERIKMKHFVPFSLLNQGLK